MTLEKRQPIPVIEAIQRCIKQDINLPETTVDLYEADGYILAEDIIATYDIPRFDKSPYDGFAIRSEDSTDASGEQRVGFKVIDHIGAGSVSQATLAKGEAVRIMTGAEIPKGADAVVMLEQTVETKDGFTIRKPFSHHENVSLKGEETTTGDVVLKKGQRINAGAIAVLATFGYRQVPVFVKPSVAIIATGSELLDVEDALEPGKIRNSNGPMIHALLRQEAITSHMYQIQKDDFESSLNVVRQAVQEHDIVVTTGGVSVGDYDYLPDIYRALDATVLFNKVAMRPGSVTTVAVTEQTYLFGLSGNPSACYTGFELFVKPSIYRMMGATRVYPAMVKATLMEDFKKANPFTRFIRATVTFNGKEATVKPAGFNKSGAVIAIAHSNAIMVLPSGTRGYTTGQFVDVLLTATEYYQQDIYV
ncbi:molybdopterin molybdotransferase MoeA [Staphylococcus hyicus]|uniref:molybdopterin molybdotransferase MoeA n=1 Tax=Staphylococcus hyicus TaxID=1284 RepID=UPI00057DD49C|nr:gephyrin-like molybdotransferase Glp [Staphylococcus hyicus]AJC95413.1 molybdopterin molybdenumtransferase [Staphylococcus hyicus]MCQ9300316.1 molybdopterin molybdotransferase MoeA [Staphylococcus hyicus]RTX66920.1 molybdopterin molybdenumtransferase MoeA [Staphylococcus hyicus]SQE46909.1 molybdopterin biosynthesis protein [Staphylococcus hyicus]